MLFSAKPSVVLLCLVSLLTVSNACATQYTVSIAQENPRLAVVTAVIEPDGNEIRMNEEGVHGLENGWATFVEGLKVFAPDGRVIAVSEQSNSSWRLTGYNNGPVKLSYRVRLGHDQVPLNFGDNGAAYATDWGVMWAGRALFIAGKPAREFLLRFDLPETWRVTTPWDEKIGSANTFVVQTTNDLVNSAFFAGTHEQFNLEAGAVTLRVALSGDNTLTMREQITDMTGQYLNYYETVYRSSGKASMVLIAADRNSWGGEVMGRAISLSIGGKPPPGFNPLTVLAHVIAHEIFHVFSLIRMEIDDAPSFSTWFNEGFGAEYAAWLARMRLGELTQQQFLDQIMVEVAKYQSKVDGGLTLASAGYDKASNYDMVYSGGFVAAMTLDFLVRHESDGARSLDDLWVYLLNQYPRGGEMLTLGGLINATRSLYGETVSSRLSAYVNEPDPIALYDAAALLGLKVENKTLSLSDHASKRQRALWQGVLGDYRSGLYSGR